ncbi:MULTISPECIES: hypothetical protein [unclassified Streptomyces]|uniref:zinc finger domain-containing protein n=1 Tax=unclassified Streptomyces TaxID=2593676 RepID=UPI0006C00C64|nr:MULTISPECIES: hypothetical protein [unclassified Streptomyces]KOV86096.1 hypothetical protein ADL02_19600 [Streptomyces sp. NRRL WC-3723]
MNSQEAAVLCRYVRALCPQQKFDEFTPDAWADVLSAYTLNDARQAAARVAKRQPFVAPAEIADEISKLRAERTHDFRYEPPPGDRDPNYIANYRAQLAATGDGHRPPVIDRPALPARPVAELVKSLADSIPKPPDHDEPVTPVRRPGPLGRECPTCHAAIGRPCRTNRGRERDPHEAREAAAHGRQHDPDAEEQRRKNAARHLTEETA